MSGTRDGPEPAPAPAFALADAAVEADEAAAVRLAAVVMLGVAKVTQGDSGGEGLGGFRLVGEAAESEVREGREGGRGGGDDIDAGLRDCEASGEGEEEKDEEEDEGGDEDEEVVMAGAS